MRVSAMISAASALAAVTIILAVLACGGAATPATESDTDTGANMSATIEAQVAATIAAIPATADNQLPPSSSIGTPVPRSAIESAFEEPLSSGLSVADVVENALPSVVQIIAGSGSGTGFIVNESGLVVTNKHVVGGASQVTLRLASGGNFQGRVAQLHPSLDLAYIEIDADRSFTPIAVGDSGKIRVGEDVIAIGFPLGSSLGQEPTVSVGIISAKRNDRLQTDASLNPGNSGGPLLNMFGAAIGVVTSRIDSTDSGRAVAGISFAIPINEVKSGLGRQVSPSGRTLPTPTPTPLQVIGPTPDVEATKSAIQTIDAHRRQAEQATRTAIEAQQEAERYAASLEATRIAELPTPTPEPTPTPLPPTPTPTPHPAIFCEEWETMVLEWIKEGNPWHPSNDDVSEHPNLPVAEAIKHCFIGFPTGILEVGTSAVVGHGKDQLLPGTYEYRLMSYEGDNRVKYDDCVLRLNRGEENEQSVAMPYGEPFTFQFFSYHGKVGFYGTNWNVQCGDVGNNPYSALHRIGD